MRETVLIIDDEPQYLEWLIDYLESKGYAIETASTLGAGLGLLTDLRYRMIVVDLSIPVLQELISTVGAEGKTYSDYPGLYLAHHARNLGYRDRQVVVYSVHDSAAVREVVRSIRVQYITKGRPKMLKMEIDHILGFDPTTHRQKRR